MGRIIQNRKKLRVYQQKNKLAFWFIELFTIPPLQQVTIEAEVVAVDNEDKETIVSFFSTFFLKFVQFKVTSSNKYLYEQALAAAEFEFILISGVDCLQPKGRPRFVNSRFH